MPETFNLLIDGFLRNVQRNPLCHALWVDQHAYTYVELLTRAESIAHTLAGGMTITQDSQCALLANRSVTAYGAVLGALLAGMSCVPLNPAFPVQRNRAMVALSSPSAIIVDGRSMTAAQALLSSLPGPLLVLMPDAESLPEWAAAASQHRYLTRPEMIAPNGTCSPINPPRNPIACTVFSVGSDRKLQEIRISNQYACNYVTDMIRLCQPKPDDRFTQFLDFTCDLSIHDMFVCWSAGACLYCAPAGSLTMPLGFVHEHQITFCFSEPALARYLERQRALQPEMLAQLKWSLFGGETSPADISHEWRDAAGGSTSAPVHSLG